MTAIIPPKDEMTEESTKMEPRKAGSKTMSDDASPAGVITRLSMLTRIQQSSKEPSICSRGIVIRALEESGQM
jgi:hypothetical protein